MKRLSVVISTLFFVNTYAVSFPNVSLTEVKSYYCTTPECEQAVEFNLSRDRDYGNCLPRPTDVENIGNFVDDFSLSLPQGYTVAIPLHIQGAIRYRGFYLGKYSYNQHLADAQNLIITSKIYFTNKSTVSESRKNTFRNDLNLAENIWNTSAYAAGVNIRFNFEYTENYEEADQRVNFVNYKTRGPYMDTWSSAWSPEVIAHEFGHMMGLDDEYAQPGIACDKTSTMCSNGTFRPKDYHYYLILRRAFCAM